jgi:hypothetical protein
MAAGTGQTGRDRADALAAYLEPAFRRWSTIGLPEDSSELRGRLSDAMQRDPQADALYEYYTPADGRPPHPRKRPAGRPRRAAGWFRKHVWNAPGALFLIVTGLAIGLYVLFRVHRDWQVAAASGFVVLLLTLLPGFLYLRFVRYRIEPICAEYVYNLHRLGVDEPRYLPEPLRASAAWTRWCENGGPEYRNCPSIYAMKFESQYGRWPRSDREEGKDTLNRLVSVYVCLATLGVGWAFVVWTAPFAADLPRLIGALRFGFLGAYFFLLSLLIRRYFQNDLRPAAYLAGIVRVVTVLLLVVGVDQVFAMQNVPIGEPYAPENAVAFVIGVFPTVGMQLLRRTIGKITGSFRGGLEPPFPLSQLDGMDIWSESRLLEAGVEDVQHLATANLVDVVLGARISTERIVDWVDQALLLLRTGLPRIDNLREPTTYADLRALSVRSSTDLLELVDKLGLDLRPGAPWPGAESPLGALTTTQAPPPDDARLPTLNRLASVPLLTRIALAVTTLQHEPNLRLVVNWHGTAPEAQTQEQKGRPATPGDGNSGDRFGPGQEDGGSSASSDGADVRSAAGGPARASAAADASAR